ncbi:MAG: SDR family oxidoreductase [Anaerolineales bacterium]|nr:SDR family oxidoreductase [Anaerolineales bacterium]
MKKLEGKNILITGGARRLGKYLATMLARQGARVIIHYGHADAEALETRHEIEAFGGTAHLIKQDLNQLENVPQVIEFSRQFGPLAALVNNAAIFDAHTWEDADLDAWNRHLNINLSAPFLLSQAFARSVPPDGRGHIVNILDWRALRPGATHLPYTISKAGLAALTRSLAVALAPRISVNGLALGAILPPAGGGQGTPIHPALPVKRWARLDEVWQALHFLLDAPEYITGEIIHVDGGRHLI